MWYNLPVMKCLKLRLIILTIAVLAGACAPLDTLLPARSREMDVVRIYEVSLQDWARAQPERFARLPRYFIQAELDPSGDRLAGHVMVFVPNTGSTPWSDLVFRLYPNMPHYGGAMRVTQLEVNGEPVTADLAAGDAVLHIPLSQPLAPAEEVTVTMAFDVDLPRADDGYTLFGWEDATLSLPGFYPTLAVYHEPAAARAGGWATELPPPFADVLFNPFALYDLELTVPAGLTIVASGTTVSSTPTDDGREVWRIAGGPLRDMTVLASQRWESASETAAGAVVTSYYPPENPAAGQAALFHAAAALRLYSDLYGPYPYNEFDVVAAPLGVRGMEYSGLVAIGQDLYTSSRKQLPCLVAHETAHQWWYAQVGNDPLAHPWLDEGPAEYAAFDYYRGVYGQPAAEDLLSVRWRTPYAVAASNGIDGPVDQPASMMTEANYELLAYAKAALFLDAMRGWLGDQMYVQVMHTYVETYRWRIATPQGFLGLAQTVSGVNLRSLAEQWLR